MLCHVDDAMEMFCVQDHPSLVKLRDELGVEGGRYDFVAQDISKKQLAYQKAQASKQEKECSVNKQVRHLLIACCIWKALDAKTPRALLQQT